ncbi:LytTR family DNA-binding domain-containing protein [Neogemmobacter tilapiae]|uniref:HTH LytTR-type domain-containing protein n=1 Tax=Neogemmobacter tilapiae TaxID=875041 RepID=A0A918TN41_9RHOB|nr:LytTR family DNA-binding domain-containing protein [Gemmobacter tilapiae]GHC52130.1 hypothetical protein GCM10007315_13290 [Gemmobacter tilapiae]
MSSRSHFHTLDGLVARIDPRNSWIGYLIAAGTLLAIGLAVSEPSASQGLDLPARFVFWLAHVASALFLFELAQIHLGRIALFERLPPLLLVLAVGVVGAFFFAVFNLVLLDRIVELLDGQMDQEPISVSSLLDELRDSGVTSVLFWVLLNGPRLIMIAQQKDADEPPSAERPDSLDEPSAFGGALLDLLSRLPRRIGTDIVAISAELHYLRVYTRNGEALILMSFGRAVEALDVIPGQPIHRSHWVALAHIARLENDGNRVFCQLDTGLELPVSRSHRARLRAALAVRDEQQVLQTAHKMSAVPRQPPGLLS